ncbi:MAG: LysM peptidoglycan-binding domain-containing protein [Patescibacteria group bacterium]
MEPKLIFATLGVAATLMLGNGAPTVATSNKTETKSQVTTATTTKAEVKTTEPEVKAEEVKAEEVITVQSGDTLESIATAHNTTYVRLFNANPGIANPDMIDVGNQITIPAAEKELEDRFAQIAPVATAATATYTTQQYSSAPVNSSSYYVGNGMWCTDYVHSKRPDVAIYGNAGYNWIGSAQAAGKSTGSAPQAGAVAVMDGHVAYVESVNGDGSYVVSEMGWNYQPGNYNQRTVQPGAFGSFIY